MLPSWNVLVSEFFGYLSISAWIVVFIPQLYENYQRKSADSLSLHFLVLWFIGDIFNLIGSVYQEVLYTIILLSFYFLAMDVVTIGQYLYYSYWYTPKALDAPTTPCATPPAKGTPTETSPLLTIQPASSASNQTPAATGPGAALTTLPIDALLPTPPAKAHCTRLNVLLLLILSSITMVLINHWSDLACAGRGDNSYPDSPTSQDGHVVKEFRWFPQVCAWISVVLYIGARIPQIVENYRNKSCEGLALSMFLCCVLGNSAFCLSIFFHSIDPAFLLVNLPWLLGSGGTLAFDFTIFYQFYVYHHQVPKVTVNDYVPEPVLVV
ncbi:putative vacuolar membrane transporter for cationic amino acids [Dimargaris xerosporica]|nr:putative vacuolar membrane transporter for cationic amino acids [Dimargaris xerosporica]